MINLRNIKPPPLDVRRYKKFQPALYAKLIKAAKKIQGKNIIHINSSANGGGVAELLRGQISFERSLGLKSEWYILEAPKNFFAVTKKIHNQLQGKDGRIGKEEKSHYLSINRQLEDKLKKIIGNLNSGIVVIHDPQPLPLIQAVPKNFSTVCRLHVDMETPNPEIINFLKPYLLKFQNIILSNKIFVGALSGIKKSKIKIIPPAIDPLSRKNRPMKLQDARKLLKKLQINYSKPLVTQVSRFDPWKDPLGVIKAFCIAKNKIPNLQLALAGSAADDDPEGSHIYKKIKRYTRGYKDIFLFSDMEKKAKIKMPEDIFINSLYTISDIIIQKSLREGFGLTITEAMWKRKPVIAGMASGSKLQIKNKRNGLLVSSPEETARAIIELLRKPKLRNKIGKAAHQSVLKKFLLPQYIFSHLKLYLKSRP